MSRGIDCGHPHVKPVGLLARLIEAVTETGDLVVDPAAGSFGVMHVARRLGRIFIGCDHVAKAMQSLMKSPDGL
jgi:site-specific DNA-methyltransferase (adenine-specific)